MSPKKLSDLIHGKKCIVAPGVFDGLSAKLVEQAGFQLMYASGGAISRSMGYPDLGLVSFKEVCERLENIVDATDLPVIADADTGYGNSLNVYRTVRAFQKIGVAGLHIEDQEFPKRCGHLNDKTLISIKDMQQKIKTAKDASDIIIIARTDAIASESFESAIERAQAYGEAGANMIFIEAPESVEQIEEIGKLVNKPKLINMFLGGKTPLVPLSQLEKFGYSIVIIPSDLQRAAIKSMQEVLKIILKNGDSKAIADQMVSFKDREEIIQTKRYLDLDKK